MKKLELKVPPVALFFLVVLLMYGLKEMMPGLKITVPFVGFVSIGLASIAIFVGVAGVMEFHKAKTTVNPVKPESASTVVDSGIFSYTRNPMYVALLLVIIALGLWWQHLSVILCSVLFVAYMNRFQIKPEERALERLFGEDYVDYKNQVRRWI